MVIDFETNMENELRAIHRELDQLDIAIKLAEACDNWEMVREYQQDFDAVMKERRNLLAAWN